MDGKPCVNIIRTEWSPSYGIELLFNGILFLFLEPNPRDGLNHEASHEMIFDDKTFRRHVLIGLLGGIIETKDVATKDPIVYTIHRGMDLDESLVGSDISFANIGVSVEDIKRNYELMHQVGHETFLEKRMWSF